MAIYFDGLVGTKSQSSAAQAVKRLASRFSLHHESPSQWSPKSQLYWVSVVPRGMGLGVPYDDEQDREKFKTERKTFARDFYEMIRRENDIEVALLGWEISDRWFDPTEKNRVLAGVTQIPNDMISMPGLVVSNEILEMLPNQNDFRPYTNRLHWVQIENWDRFESF